jgi:hypothetical protein
MRCVDTAWRLRVATLEIVDRTGRFDITELLAELRRHFDLEKYIAHVNAHRLNISRDLFDFLMEYNRTVGEPLDINVAWAFFRTAHPYTTDSCHMVQALAVHVALGDIRWRATFTGDCLRREWSY